MADQIRRVDYFYVEVPDKPGEGARVLTALKEAGVNLLNFTAFRAPAARPSSTSWWRTPARSPRPPRAPA